MAVTAVTGETQSWKLNDPSADEFLKAVKGAQINIKAADTPGAAEPTPQDYENHMNELASDIAGSVDVDKRMLVYLTDPKNEANFKYLVEYKLREQAKNGKQPNVGDALKEVKDLLWSRIELAANNSGKNGGKVIDVVNGYWDRHGGKDHARDMAMGAYGNYLAQNGPKTDSKNFDENLNALAGLLVGGTMVDQRMLALGLDNETASKLYANLIKAKLDQQGSPLNLDQAAEEVNKALFDKMGELADKSGAGKNAVIDVIKGYWDRHAGKEEADTIARKTFEEFQAESPPSGEESSQVNPNANFDDEVNAVAAGLAASSFGGSTGSIKSDAIRDHYATLIYLTLQQQAKDGKPVDLDATYKEVKEHVWGRLGNALRDDPKAREKLDALDKYWNDGKGKSDASDVAREAYSVFLKDTVLTNNPNYEDNLNALALGIGGGPIGDTRTLSPLNDPTLAALYKNLITDKLGKGVSLDDATKQVNDELFNRLPHALRDHTDSNGKIDIIKGYWDRHGGKTDATRLAEDAYSGYVSDPGSKDKNLLAPSATDIMSAKTVDGRTVQEIYYEKLRKAYENEPADSDKRKFLRVIDAKIMQGGAYKYLPYAHDDPRNLTYYSDNPAAITEAEAKGLLNEDELEKQFTELAAKPDIAADNEKFLREAVGEVKDKQGLEDRIVATMTSPTYEKDVLALGDKAQERFASDLRSLHLLNPDKALEIQQKLSYSGAFKQVNDLLADPSKLTPESIKASARDIGDTFARAEVLGIYAGDAASRLYEAWDDWRSGRVANLDDLRFGDGSALTAEEKASLKLAANTSDTLTEILTKRIEAARASGGNSWMANITDALKDPEVKAAMEYAGVPESNRGKITTLMSAANANGAITTAGGLACIVAAVLTLTKDGGKNLTTAERLGSAFYLLFTGSGITEATSQVTGAMEKLLKLPGMKEAIGLDKNAKNVWAPATETTLENSKLWRTANSFVNTKVGSALAAEYAKLPENVRNFINSSVDRLSRTLGPGVSALSATDKLKLIGPGLKVLGSLAYGAGGIIGIYLGIDGLINRKDKTAPEIAGAALGLGAGIVWTGAAGIGLAGAFGIGSAAASTVAVGLGAVGIVLSVIGLGIFQAIKYAKQEKAAGDVRAYFNALAKDGVLEPDWGTKLNYMIHVQYLYHSKKITQEWYDLYFPKGMAPWEAQPEHYKAFTEANKNNKASIDWWFPYREPSQGLLKPHGNVPDHLDFVKPGYTTWTEHGGEGRGPK